MSARASFKLDLRGRNPDVLTCIANLSNDEVFTPPDLANRMLDMLADAWAADHGGASIWADGTVKFLDPCTKSGVFLREITRRLVRGLTEQIPNLQERVDHVLTQQIFGIGLTHLTSMMARRSVYCSKHANGPHSITSRFDNEEGNIWFQRTEHTWVKGKCSYCGANRKSLDRGEGTETHAYAFIHADDIKARIAELFGGNMQFDVILGNPPYHLGQSGGNSIGGFAMPIYQKFVQAAKSAEPRYMAMITPSRWFSGGRGLDDYRSEMLEDRRIRTLADFPDASEAFPGTQIKGGVSYFLWDSFWNDNCEVSTVHKSASVSVPVKRDLRTYDVFVRRNEAIPILEKVLELCKRDGIGDLSAKVSPIQPFGIRTDKKGSITRRGMKEPVRVIGRRSETFFEKQAVPKNWEWIEQWKVLLGRAYGAGDSFPHQIFNYPIVSEPGTACSETYLVAGCFNQEILARNFARYLRTRFVRFLVSLRKNTQDIYNGRFRFVPDLPMDDVLTDEALYRKFRITKKEITFIESMIRPMDEEND